MITPSQTQTTARHTPRRWLGGFAWAALIASGVLPILALLTGPNTTLLLYTIFVGALLFQRRISRAFEWFIRSVRLGPEVSLVICILLSG